MRTFIGSLLAAALALFAAPALASNLETRAFNGISARDVYVQPSVAKLVNQRRLAYAARIASRAADGAPMKIAFVDIPQRKLKPLSNRLFQRLNLAPSGALVVGTPKSVTIRTQTLTVGQEDGIVALDAGLFARRGAGYTVPLSELIYDVGLVIHNSRPGVSPRGMGRDSNLATFSGTFPDERHPPLPTDRGGSSSDWTLPASMGWIAAGFAGLLIYARLRWRRLSGR
jgi:hypothetical protein